MYSYRLYAILCIRFIYTYVSIFLTFPQRDKKYVLDY